MDMKEDKVNPYSVELLDVLEEVGGTMMIQYHTATITLTADRLRLLRDNGLKTDVTMCLMAGLMALCGGYEGAVAFVGAAEAAGARLSVTFEAPEGGSLNIRSREKNPMVDMLLQAVSNI